jgi:type IV pilus assembly protein PilY1
VKKISIISSTILTFSILYSASSMSEDIDIYKKISKSGSKTNIMFMIDTSGSMSARVDGTDKNRLEAVQDSMYDIIESLDDEVNVGVGAYNGFGGSIVYPVKRLGDYILNKSISSIYSGEDDGLETESGSIHNDSQAMGFGLNEYDTESNITRIEKTIERNDHNAIQCTDESNFDTNPSGLNLGLDFNCDKGHSLGVKFNGLDIPKNAKLKNVFIEFKSDFDNSGKNINTRIYLENSSNPLSYYENTSNQLSNTSDLFRQKRVYNKKRYQKYNYDIIKNFSSTIIDWAIVGQEASEKIQTPNLKDSVQELINDDSWLAGSSSLNFVIKTEDLSTTEMLYLSSKSDSNIADRPKLVVEFEGEDKNFGSNKNLIGLNFKGVKVSSFSNIEKAELQLTSDFDYWNDNDNEKTLKIKIVDPRDAASITSSNKLSTRRIIAEKVVTFPATTWSDGDVKRFDIKDLIQQAVNTNDWCGGQDLTVILEDLGTGWQKLKSIKAFDNARKREVFTSLYIEQGEESPNSCMIRDVVYNINSSENDGDSSTVTDVTFDIGLTKSAVRFENVMLSPTDEILDASILMNSSDSGDLNIKIYNDLSNNNNPLNYDSSIPEQHISNRITFGTSTSINLIKTSSENFEIPNLAGLVSNTLTNSGWALGNAMSFIFINDGSSKDFKVESYDGQSDLSPKLKIRVKSRTSNSKERVRDKIVSLVQQMQYGGGTPTLGSTLEAYNYFTNNTLLSGKGRSRKNNFISHRDSWEFSDDTYIKTPVGCGDLDPHNPNCKYQKIVGNPKYVSPMKDSECETNSMIMLTDGQPSSSPYHGLSNSITGDSCNGEWECIKSITRHMANNDIRADLSAEKSVITNVIGFAMGSDSNMHQYAEAGNGAFYTVFDSKALVDTVSVILTNTIDSDTSLAMPGVSVDQSNRLQFKNDLYFSVFKPENKRAWAGNLKKYKVKEVVESENKEFNIVDQFDANAVNKETGFFRDDSTSIWSAEVDGSTSDKGGAASRMDVNRNIFTFVNSTEPNDTKLSGNDFKFTKENLKLTKDHFTPTDDLDDREVDEVDGNGNYTGNTVMVEEYSKFLDWINGYDIKDKDDDGDTTDARYEMSDPLHAKPIIIDYNDSDVTVFVSTNDGTLHGIDASNGDELFAFVPERVLPNLYYKYKNGVADHQYGLDLTWSAYRHDSDKNGNIDHNDDFVYIYGGMRRGGDSIYALDVTNIKASNDASLRVPTFKWEINKDTSEDFINLGQTWSTPIITRVKFNGKERIVLMFAGGYDTINDDTGLNTDTQKGNQVYMVDAETGQLLWWASNLASGADTKIDGMSYSIPNKISVIDVDNDGYTDYIYANDTSGQIFKFKIDVNNEGAASFAKGKIFAKMGKTDKLDQSSDRKYFEKIAIIPVIDSVGESLYVISGTGHRSNPLSKRNKDGLFVLRDTEINPSDFSILTSPITIDDLYDVTHTKDEDDIMTNMSTSRGYLIWMNEGMEPSQEGFEGEKIIGNIVVANSKLIFTSYVPDNANSSCQSIGIGNARTYVVNLYTGAPERMSSSDTIDESLSVYKQRYITEPLPGFSSGAKILYTADGVIAITNTSVNSVDDILGLGLFKDKWFRVHEKVNAIVPPHIWNMRN